MVLFIFTAVAFGVFDIIYFRLALKALDIGQFSWWMCRKKEIQTKVLSLKSSNFSKFYPNSLKLCTWWETTAAQKRVQEFYKNEALAQTNQINYDCFFLHAQKTQKIVFSKSKSGNKIFGHVFVDFICSFIAQWKNFEKK